MPIAEQTVEALAVAGFTAKNAGTFQACFSKTMKAWDMPYMKEHAIDGENIYEDTDVVLSVSLDAMVTMTIESFPGANEGPYSVYADEGAALLRDAGVKLSI